MVDQIRQAADDVLVVQDDFVVIGSEELRDGTGVPELVQARLVGECN